MENVYSMEFITLTFTLGGTPSGLLKYLAFYRVGCDF